jgi:endonuclease/exonuclease/phosphatase (EEP) superfamily protein YafD
MRRVYAIGAWAGAGACVAWTLCRLLGLEGGFPLVQLMAYTPYAALGAFVIAGLNALVRLWWPATFAMLTTVLLLTAVLPRAIADNSVASRGVVVRVLSVNLRIGGTDPAAVVDLVRRVDADLVALQEYTPQAQAALDREGLATVLPYRSAHPRELALGSALYSRFPVRADGVRRHDSGFWQAQATVQVPGAGWVAVESAHPCAPTGPARSACWQADLADQPHACPHGQLRLLLGDFNATLDHAPLRRLIGTGYRDAASAVGAGLKPTWPYDRSLPKVTLDHILVDRRIGVRRFTTYPVRQTDHRAVFAELVLPIR